MSREGLEGAKILILIGGHLATAPRPLKEATALQSSGAKVMVRGIWWDPQLADEDVSLARQGSFDFAPAVDVNRGIGIRVRQRLAREGFTRFGMVTPRTFGIGAPELLREARRIGADLTMVHSEAGLWVGQKLMAERRRVGVDFEDWFSHDLAESDRKGRPVAALQALERTMLRQAQCCLTTTRVLAEALAADARTSRVPSVVPNCFPAAEREAALTGARDSRAGGAVSFHWFSQTIGPGRGLETLAQSLPLLRGKWQLNLRGSLHGHSEWFEATFPPSIRSRIQILEIVPNADLLARTMSHDVGLALEEPYCASKDLTAANKLFEYMRAGLAVIATRTRGQEEVLRTIPDVGVLIDPEDPNELARAMQAMIDDPKLVQARRERAAAAAESTWSWERHAPTLINSISAAVESGYTCRSMP